MEFAIELKALKRGLNRVLTIVDRRSTMAILENVLVEAGSDSVKLTASDLEVSSIGTYPAKVAKQGAITIPARKFHEMIQSLDEAGEEDRKVTVKSRDSKGVDIVCGVVKFQLVGMNADEFPALPPVDAKHWVEIDGTALLGMVQRTLFAVSTDETRYNLNGVYFEPGGGDVLKLVATDGHRLALAEGSLQGARGLGLKEGIILPRKGLAELVKLLETSTEKGKLAVAGSHAVFQTADVQLRMRLLEGQFPDYAQVIPVDNDRRAKVPLARFVAALRHTNPLSGNKTSSVKLEFSKGKLVLSSQDPEIGMARDEFEIDFDGDEIAVGFNPRYLVDALGAMKGAESVVLELADDLSPTVMRPEGESTYLCVVMPMRI